MEEGSDGGDPSPRGRMLTAGEESGDAAEDFDGPGDDVDADGEAALGDEEELGMWGVHVWLGEAWKLGGGDVRI